MSGIAEVIASSTRVFTAEVYSDAQLPALGQWVCVAPAPGIEAYGVVSYVEMVPFDEARSAIALRRSEEELRREMPHVMELLRTVMRVQLVAHRVGSGNILQTLPPYPPRIHTLVYPCRDEAIRLIGEPYDFLRVLMDSSERSALSDDLLVAVLARLAAANPSSDGQVLVAAGKVLIRMLGDDAERLRSIIRRVAEVSEHYTDF